MIKKLPVLIKENNNALVTMLSFYFEQDNILPFPVMESKQYQPTDNNTEQT